MRGRRGPGDRGSPGGLEGPDRDDQNSQYADPRYRNRDLNRSCGPSGLGISSNQGRTGKNDPPERSRVSGNSDRFNSSNTLGGPSFTNSQGRTNYNSSGKSSKLGGTMPQGHRNDFDETIDPRYAHRGGPGGLGRPGGPEGPKGPGMQSGPGRKGGPAPPGGKGGRKFKGFHGKGRREFKFKKIKGQRHFKFNPFQASSWSQTGQQNFQETELPVNEFTKEEFVELRTNNTEQSALEQLNDLATELTSSNKSSVTSNPRACLICCNNYTKPSYKLGVGPVNDSVTVAANHKYMGYKVFYLHNPKSTLFLEYLQLFLQKTTEYLSVYYTGHGSSSTDKNGDEEDGKDEVMVFDDNYVVDDKLAEILTKYANGKTKVVLINDCCHSGTLYDIPSDMDKAEKLPANIICLSAADDDETAKQGQQNSNDQGFFTFFFFQEVRRNSSITPEEILNNVSSQLKTYEQCVVASPTREELMTSPIFPQ